MKFILGGLKQGVSEVSSGGVGGLAPGEMLQS